MTFQELEFYPTSHPGIQAIKFFPNGYGVSVVKISGSYGSDRGLYEMAILKGKPTNPHLCYTTPLTDDVLRYLSEENVTSYLKQVEDLPS